jgi:uncharacterized protein (DUF302 family)
MTDNQYSAMRQTIKHITITLLIVHAITIGLIKQTHATEDNIVTTRVEGDFVDVSANVRAAIIGKGINIANTLPASEMLHRTGPAFGYKNDVYPDAITYEFCSASISHKLARTHPDNIVLCPFTISVYVVSDEPDFVRMSYRIPTGKPGTEAIIKEIVDLIQSIIDDATW